jgi:hypothetical protein
MDNVLLHLASVRDKTRDNVDNVIDSEVGYIFTNDIEYLTEANKKDKMVDVKDSKD